MTSTTAASVDTISAFRLQKKTEYRRVESIIMASLMKINCWSNHITAEPSLSTKAVCLYADYMCMTWIHVSLHSLTTSRMSLFSSKFGFFFMLRMTQLWTTVPPHSTCRLGELTLANWKLFRLRTPQARIWTGRHWTILIVHFSIIIQHTKSKQFLFHFLFFFTFSFFFQFHNSMSLSKSYKLKSTNTVVNSRKINGCS